ncbi:DedA family protein [Brevibacillus sp. TJ4]|uniref:DedA family protein n=1 Tax=Brevibacillus sp. TJ4 TaxID=3234853 RepID=UPI0037CDCCE2
MDLDLLSDSVSQYGYPALFFLLWLGIVGMPIPDEVIVLSAGVLTSLGVLRFVPAFIATYLGVVSGLSVGYVLGRMLGAPALNWLSRKKGMDKHLARAQQLLDRYGSFALCISYFFPVVRHVVPYLVGIGKMSFRKYALFSYTTGLVWSIVLFVAGYVLGDNVEVLEGFRSVFNQGAAVVGIAVVLAGTAGAYGYKVWKGKQQARKTRQETEG